MQPSVNSLSENLTFLNDETREVCLSYLEALDSPSSLGIYLCLKYGDDTSACSHEIDPRCYEDESVFRSDYLAVSLLSKFSSGVKSQDLARRSAAEVKFRDCEAHMDATSPYLTRAIRVSSVESDVLYIAQEKIAQWLGRIDTASYMDLCSFGPGSSTSVPRRKAHPSNKFLSADVTASAAPLVSWFFQDARFPRPKFNLIEASRVEFVPKNFKTDRIIAVEPDWNIFFQKGAGKLIRRQLRKIGLDLDNLAEVHGRLSSRASLSGDVATIDLSSASDTISTRLIRFLLPDQWFFFLNSLRTDRVVLNGKEIPVKKFSSMGNGFTFELESLVFYALSVASCIKTGTRGPVSVFGDDIIIPNGALDVLERTLTVCGFKLNHLKSYKTGYFRESCGYHFFNGWDVKPIYIKENICNDFQRYKFCNALRRLTHRFYDLDVLDHVLRRPFTLCLNRIRRKFFIPDGYGDGGLISFFDEITPATSRRGDKNIFKYSTGIEGYRVRCLQPTRAVDIVEHRGLLLHRLRHAYLSKKSIWHQGGVPLFRVTLSDLRRADFLPEVGNLLTFSQSNVSWRVGTMHIPRWFDPGSI